MQYCAAEPARRLVFCFSTNLALPYLQELKSSCQQMKTVQYIKCVLVFTYIDDKSFNCETQRRCHETLQPVPKNCIIYFREIY